MNFFVLINQRGEYRDTDSSLCEALDAASADD
jgi:hypothetical protein